MKKYLAILFMLITVIVSSVGAYATESDVVKRHTLRVGFNGELSDAMAVLHQEVYYLPVRKVFENLGAYVFFRGSDRQILILTRDGDMIRHIIGDCNVTVNDIQKTFEVPSVIENGETYIPMDMIIPTLCPDKIVVEKEYIDIQKYMFQSDYHKKIQEVLDWRGDNAFYPEKFQRYLSYYMKMPNYSIEEVIFRVNLGLDYPSYENITTIAQPYELLVLVNKYHQLPADFMQYNLVHMAGEYTARDGKEYLLAGVAYEKYAQMAEAAKSDGISMRVVSAYRTESYQRTLYNNKLRTTGKANADRYSAMPGHSEHQTGLAVDINSTYVSFENTAAYRWLQEHAHEYGFILRYPKGKEWVTGYAYEPWHYRYVGADAATVIVKEGITFEEYYVKYVCVNEFK